MSGDEVIVIAHRGASGYLPEHTLAAKAFAYALGADFLEQDVVATRDDELIVLHDIHLDRVTDVARRFPDRHRDDGRYYARDFDLAEIKTLRVHERRGNDGISAVYPNRFPTDVALFDVPTLREEIRMVQGLNRSTGRSVGIYPEIKRPAWHRDNGIDLSRAVVQLLHDSGYRSRADNAFLQCFDADEVRRVRHELKCELRLVQLIADNSWAESTTDYEALLTPDGLQEIAGSADAIGPWINQLVTTANVDGRPVSTGVVRTANDVGLQVHPFTFRCDDLAPGFDSMSEMVSWSVDELGVDGLFTDFPDVALAALGRVP